jgi:hypothetical protein
VPASRGPDRPRAASPKCLRSLQLAQTLGSPLPPWLILLKRQTKKRTESIPDTMPTIGQATLWIGQLGGHKRQSLVPAEISCALQDSEPRAAALTMVGAAHASCSGTMYLTDGSRVELNTSDGVTTYNLKGSNNSYLTNITQKKGGGFPAQ